MIKVISFDIGNTIIKNNGISTVEQIEKILHKNRKEFIKEYKAIFQTSNDSLEECVSKFLEDINKKEGKTENNIKSTETYKKIMELFKGNENKNIIINNEKIEVINELKRRGYKIIAISNACKYKNIKQKEIIRKSGLFDEIFYSFEIGFCKPSPEIFKIVEKRLNVRPYEILHIGDSINSDYYPAINVGWNAILYDPNDMVKDKNIIKIKEFKEILKKLIDKDNEK